MPHPETPQDNSPKLPSSPLDARDVKAYAELRENHAKLQQSKNAFQTFFDRAFQKSEKASDLTLVHLLNSVSDPSVLKSLESRLPHFLKEGGDEEGFLFVLAEEIEKRAPGSLDSLFKNPELSQDYRDNLDGLRTEFAPYKKAHPEAQRILNNIPGSHLIEGKTRVEILASMTELLVKGYAFSHLHLHNPGPKERNDQSYVFKKGKDELYVWVTDGKIHRNLPRRTKSFGPDSAAARSSQERSGTPAQASLVQVPGTSDADPSGASSGDELFVEDPLPEELLSSSSGDDLSVDQSQKTEPDEEGLQDEGDKELSDEAILEKLENIFSRVSVETPKTSAEVIADEHSGPSPETEKDPDKDIEDERPDK